MMRPNDEHLNKFTAQLLRDTFFWLADMQLTLVLACQTTQDELFFDCFQLLSAILNETLKRQHT
jgi:hypothetical protein